MLETRMPPISARTRRSHAPAGTSGSSPISGASRNSGVARDSGAGRPLSRGNTALDPAPTVPARAHTRPSARLNRLAHSEMRLMGVATTCTAVVCGLLLLYLAAYAQVTQLGVAQSQARLSLRLAQSRNQILRAERDRLESPQRIAAAAASLGMTPRGTTVINYIHASRELQKMPEQVAREPGEWEQGSIGGTTADHSAASFRH